MEGRSDDAPAETPIRKLARLRHPNFAATCPGVQRAVKVLVQVHSKTGHPDAAARWKAKLATDPKG